ncbi:MAG: 3-phosphoshikimate 1-carboxyvinyltransferase [Candidatus Westeberhardia cardiocondylae]|nr:3-phosphoshikimate 1-carboxyvinyltransferase [Candidatus Westeberhardia cardiocondylae]
MEKKIVIKPISYVNGTINLPGSKSISNRVLLLAAQSDGITCINNLLDSDDVRYMLIALQKLNVNYFLSPDRNFCKIYGLGKPLYYNSSLTLFLGNAGTAMRPLTAALSLNSKDIILTGISRMKERPINHLVDALRQGGAKIQYLEKNGYPPIKLFGGYEGGIININSKISSQFLSSLLMMAPLASKDTYISIRDDIVVSKPYISLTLKIMKVFGIEIYHDHYKTFHIKGKSVYKSPGEYTVEGDASSASYFLAAGAIKGGTVRVTGIDRSSIQGDIGFSKVLQKMGAKIYWGNNYIECKKNNLYAIDMDMNHIPDSAMTVAILALFVNKKKTTILRNIYNWRVKETDRLSAMTNELRKVGAYVLEKENSLEITPPDKFNPAIINTYDDHRIAMCFSLIALSNVSITILNPKCTYKTFPNFFKQLKKISIFSQDL